MNLVMDKPVFAAFPGKIILTVLVYNRTGKKIKEGTAAYCVVLTHQMY